MVTLNEKQKKNLKRITVVSIKNIPEKEMKSAQYKLEKLSFFGKIMIAFGAMTYWIEKMEFQDGMTTRVEYNFCSGFRKWHPLFWILSVVSFLFHLINSVITMMRNFFFGDLTDYFKTYRWRL